MRAELGKFNYEVNERQDGIPVEKRPMQELEHHVRYEGEWRVD